MSESMRLKLTTHHILFRVEVIQDLEIAEQCGSALRGSLFEALWVRFCNNKQAQSCSVCPLHEACPVSSLVAPLRENREGQFSHHGRDLPRPYVIVPPLGAARIYQPGEQFTFGITLFGNIFRLLPYISMSIALMEQQGLGRPLAKNAGKRGQYRVLSLDVCHPFTGEHETIYRRGETQLHPSTLCATAQDVEERLHQFSPEEVSLKLLTPLRLTAQSQILRTLQFPVFLQRLLERLNILEQEYGSGELPYPSEEIKELVIQAEEVVLKQQTNWKELQSHSRRLQRSTYVSGFLGEIALSGDLRLFLEPLIWGELVHVGKNVTKGNGWYRLQLPTPREVSAS
jgi:hypothetical protein